MANLLTHVLPVAPYRASAPLLALLTASLAMRVVLYFLLRRDSAYSASRKYVIAGLDLAIFTAAPLLLGAQGAYPWLFLAAFSVCIYCILIVLSALRYSSEAVRWTAGLAIVLQTAIYPWLVAPEYRLPVLMVGVVTLALVGVGGACLVSSLIQLHRQAVMKDHLSRFLAPELVAEIERHPEVMLRKTERRTATVIFTDIRGFTKFSERMEPERVVEFLNEFLEQMTGAILDHQGMLDKYIGDAVMGVFGVPVLAEDHAQRALRAAVDMRGRLKEMNAGLEKRGLPALSYRHRPAHRGTADRFDRLDPPTGLHGHRRHGERGQPDRGHDAQLSGGNPAFAIDAGGPAGFGRTFRDRHRAGQKPRRTAQTVVPRSIAGGLTAQADFFQRRRFQNRREHDPRRRPEKRVE